MLMPVRRTRRLHTLLRGTAVLALLAIVATTAIAQPGRARRAPVIVKGATIHTATGEVLENGTIVIVGGKIRAIGEDLQIPPGA